MPGLFREWWRRQRHRRVIVGAREAIVEDDWMYVQMDAPLLLVDKPT
jgi:hypothetical protein